MFVFLLLAAFILLPSVSPALSPEEELKKIQEEMQEKQRKLKDAQHREHSVLGEIEDVNKKLGKIEADLQLYKKKLSQIEAEIAAVTAGIEQTKRRLERQKDWIRRKMRAMNRIGYSGDVVINLLSSEDAGQMMRTWKYLAYISRHEHKLLTDYRNNLAILDEKNTRLQELRATFASNEKKTRMKENEMEEQKKTKEQLLSTVRKEKSAYQKMLAELQEASKRLNDLIRKSDKGDDYVGITGFGKAKGKLQWPVEGTIAIPYGSQKDLRFDTTVFRNGVHIQADHHADVKSVAEGKVIFAEWFKGFGQLVIINHGNGYHTLYGNLSEIFSRLGDIIKERQVMGKVGTSGILNAPGLYFEIRYKGKPLDPAQWLVKKKR